MKKNFKFMLLALMAVFGFNSAKADIIQGDVFSDNDYYYVVTDVNETKASGTVYIQKINTPKIGEITLPSVVKKYDGGKEYTFIVEGIADALNDVFDIDKDAAAFKDQTQLTKVTIPNTFKYIGTYAFYGCTNLATIDFSSATALETIADKALVTIQVTKYDFSACTKLTGFTGTPFVDPDVLDKNNFIQEIKLPTSNAFKTIGTALAHLPNLTTLNIAESKVQEIVANAFEGDAKLTEMALPGSVKNIFGAAFEGSSVATLTIDATMIQQIGAATVIPAEGEEEEDEEVTAVYGADAGTILTSLTITNELKGKIKGGAFAGEDELTTLNLACTFGTTGQIESEAFAGIDKITKVTLGDITDHAGQDWTIMPNAFYGGLLAEVEVGDISTGNAIAAGAFNAPATEEEGEEVEAIPTLTKVTIKSVKADHMAIAEGAFRFADAASTVTVGEVRALSAVNPVFGQGAFTFTAEATPANPKATTIVVGAVSAAGNNFSDKTFANTTATTLTFNGDIESNAIDVQVLADNSLLKTLTFNGKVAENGIGGENGTAVFGDMPNEAVVNFNGALAENAVAANAFALSEPEATYEKDYKLYYQEDLTPEQIGSAMDYDIAVQENPEVGTFISNAPGYDGVYLKYIGKDEDENLDFELGDEDRHYADIPEGDNEEDYDRFEDELTGGYYKKKVPAEGGYSALTVNYDLTNVAAEDLDETVNPINQLAFIPEQLESDEERTVTLTITGNEDVFNFIATRQISCADPLANLDIIYAVKFLIVEDPEALTLKVYQQEGTNTSYGRWYITAEKYPNGLKISRRGYDEFRTLNLYTTYVEDDDENQVVNINMQPIVSTDGYYYLPLSAYYKEAVEDNPETEDVDESEEGFDGLVILAKATRTTNWEDEVEYEEYDGEEASVFYTDYRVTVPGVVVTNEQLRGHSGAFDVADGDDLYFITNPEYHEGISAPYYDFRNNSNIFIAPNSFVVTAPHYEKSQGARLIWHDGEEDATAIMATKKVATGKSGVIYNLAGQKVNASYKGIVIKDGKKMIQK